MSDQYGNVPLHIAAQEGYVEIVRVNMILLYFYHMLIMNFIQETGSSENFDWLILMGYQPIEGYFMPRD